MLSAAHVNKDTVTGEHHGPVILQYDQSLTQEGAHLVCGVIRAT